MEPQISDYPERLFSQPNFDLLFKYIPERDWPKIPDYRIIQLNGFRLSVVILNKDRLFGKDFKTRTTHN